MKNALRFLATMTIAVASAHAQTTGTVTITGYAVSDHSIKGNIAQQLNTNVVAPIRSALKQNPDGQLVIRIIGNADVSGKHNDDLGLTRATEVQGFLQGELPEATFGPYSQGSELDSRTVVVSWKIIPVAALSQKETQDSVLLHHIMFRTIALAVAAVIALLVIVKRGRKPQPPRQAAPRIVEAERDGKIICVPITNKSSLFITPLPAPNDVRDNFQDAKKAAKNGIKNKTHGVSDSQLQELIEQGKIWIKGEAA